MIIPIIIHQSTQHSPPTFNDVTRVWRITENNTFIPLDPIWFPSSTLDESPYSINIKMLVFHDHSNYHSSLISILTTNIQWCNMSLRKNGAQYFHPFNSNFIALFYSWWICIFDQRRDVRASWWFSIEFDTHHKHPMMQYAFEEKWNSIFSSLQIQYHSHILLLMNLHVR